VVTPTQPANTLTAGKKQQIGGHIPMQPRTYEITFTGQAGTTLRAEFDDCAIAVGPSSTTLRAELPDQAAVVGLIQRITGLGLEVVHLRVAVPATPVAMPPPGPGRCHV
jgi:hypothetical protein